MMHKNMRTISYAFLMTVIMLLTVVSSTFARPAVRDSYSSTCGDLSEESEKTVTTSAENEFTILFGFLITDAVITEVIFWPEEGLSIVFCEPLERVTVIGYGTYSGPTLDERFYLKIFYNVSSIMACTYKEVEVTGENQTIFLFHTPLTPCILYVQ